MSLSSHRVASWVMVIVVVVLLLIPAWHLWVSDLIDPHDRPLVGLVVVCVVLIVRPFVIDREKVRA